MEQINQVKNIEIPKDLFEFDYSQFDEDHIPDFDEQVDQFYPRIKKILDNSDPKDKEKILEAIEDEFAKQNLGEAENALYILKNIYRKIILSN